MKIVWILSSLLCFAIFSAEKQRPTIEQGDVVKSVDGQKIDSPESALKLFKKISKGNVDIVVDRKGHKRTIAGGTETRFYYIENYPKEKLELEFTAERICQNDTDRMDIKQFTSNKNYSSGKTKKKESVRIINLYAMHFSICSNKPSGLIRQKIEIKPASKMTHLYITAGPGVRVTF